MIARARTLLPAMALALVTLPAATGQDAPRAQEDPPNTLPFSPTVRSAPPERPTYPQPIVPPPPVDGLCTEIGPIIRSGVLANRFAALSAATAQGAAIGRMETGAELRSLGARYCTVVIPAASPVTAGSDYNQVTCQLDQESGETPYLDTFRTRRDALAERLSECPAMGLWTAEVPESAAPGDSPLSEAQRFSHPDVRVEVLVDASHRKRTGRWPMAYQRTLSLIFRVPNPDKPEPADEPALP